MIKIKKVIDFNSLGLNQKYVIAYLKYMHPTIFVFPSEIEKCFKIGRSGWASKICSNLFIKDILTIDRNYFDIYNIYKYKLKNDIFIENFNFEFDNVSDIDWYIEGTGINYLKGKLKLILENIENIKTYE